jgi:hypothetical protein
MKVIHTLFIILLFLQIIKAQTIEIKAIADKINIEDLKEKVYFLASDSLQGRKTYQNGQKIAANYIANNFKKNKLINFAKADNYYQKLIRYNIQGSNSNIMKIEKNLFCFFYSNYNINEKTEHEYIFAGKANDKDFKGLDLKDKEIVFIVDSLSEGITKVNKLSLIYPQNSFVICMNNKRNYKLLETVFKQKPLKISEVKSFKDLNSYEFRLNSNDLTKEKIEYAEFITDWLDSGRQINFTAIGEKQLEQLFEIKTKKLYKIARKNQKKSRNLLADVPIVKAKHHKYYKKQIDTLLTENVIGYIEGSDIKEEAILISAHYDHIGKTYKDSICYGADDNASGTAALLEVAGAYSKALQIGLKPKRTIIFAAFTAEELGLVGSWHYVNNPLFPLENTICNINMDMIGRNCKDKEKNINKVYIAGRDKGKRHRKKLFKKVNKQHDLLEVDIHPPFFNNLTWIFGSDQHSFHLKKIPSNIVYTGDHDDYHTPRDTADKINYEKLTKISRLVFLTGWQMANMGK